MCIPAEYVTITVTVNLFAYNSRIQKLDPPVMSYCKEAY